MTGNELGISGQFDDIYNSQFVGASINVTNSQVEAKVGASRISPRQLVKVYNASSVTIYYGPSGVTTTTGEPIEKKQVVAIPLGDELGLFLIAATAGPHAVIVQELA